MGVRELEMPPTESLKGKKKDVPSVSEPPSLLHPQPLFAIKFPQIRISAVSNPLIIGPSDQLIRTKFQTKKKSYEHVKILIGRLNNKGSWNLGSSGRFESSASKLGKKLN